jgi:hypothetical protein
MALTQMRRASIKVNLQWPPSTASSTINTCLRLPQGASSLALEPIAIRRANLPRHSNPHSRVRGTFRAPSPAGSFLGGFRTPATAHLARSFTAGIRNPCTRGDLAGPSGPRRLYPGERTSVAAAATSAKGPGRDERRRLRRCESLAIVRTIAGL